jgi:hypothetical protein
MRPFPLQRLSHSRIPLRTLSRQPRRHYSTPKDTTTDTSTHARLRRFNDRLPTFLRRYTTPLLSAPVTNVTSFLILHELTAVVPLFLLVGAFHYGGWLPTTFIKQEDHNGAEGESGEKDSAFDQGVARFGKWLRKKGWVDSEDVGAAAAGGASSEQGVRLILQFATAYAITKALLPVRLIASVWATPWFANMVVGPVGRGVGDLFKWVKRR